MERIIEGKADCMGNVNVHHLVDSDDRTLAMFVRDLYTGVLTVLVQEEDEAMAWADEVVSALYTPDLQNRVNSREAEMAHALFSRP